MARSSPPIGSRFFKKLDCLDPPLLYTGAYTEGVRMVQYNERSKVWASSLWRAYYGEVHIIKLRDIGMQLWNSSTVVVLHSKHYSMPPEEWKLLLGVCFSGLTSDIWHLLTTKAATMQECRFTWWGYWALEANRHLHSCQTCWFLLQEKCWAVTKLRAAFTPGSLSLLSTLLAVKL